MQGSAPDLLRLGNEKPVIPQGDGAPPYKNDTTKAILASNFAFFSIWEMKVSISFNHTGWSRALAVGLLVVTCNIGSPAWALDAPAGKVVLTVSGRVGDTNDGKQAKLDMAMLRKLPQASFTTQTPWDAKPLKFTGPRLKDVLALVKGSGTQVIAVALNDYKISIPVSDIEQHGVLLAHQIDDADIPVRTKGPLFIVYPFDSNPELKAVKYYERSIWQLKHIELQ